MHVFRVRHDYENERDFLTRGQQLQAANGFANALHKSKAAFTFEGRYEVRADELT